MSYRVEYRLCNVAFNRFLSMTKYIPLPVPVPEGMCACYLNGSKLATWLQPVEHKYRPLRRLESWKIVDSKGKILDYYNA